MYQGLKTSEDAIAASLPPRKALSFSAFSAEISSNTCREASVGGPIKVSEGKARPAGDRLGAKFKVSFFGPALLTNYWVLDRGENYEWAIVGEGSGRFLWLLTREPRPSQAERIALLARVEALGYDTDMLRYTQHMATP